MKFKLIDDRAREMYGDWGYARDGDAGLDLRCHSIAIDGFVGTGVYVEIPPGYYGDVRMRSGMSFSTDLVLANCCGTIDSGYRGEIMARFKGTKRAPSGACVHIGDSAFARLKWRISSSVRGAIRNVLLWAAPQIFPTHGPFGLLDYYDVKKRMDIGDRILQVVISPCEKVELELVDELSPSERGTGGIGSTGVK